MQGGDAATDSRSGAVRVIASHIPKRQVERKFWKGFLKEVHSGHSRFVPIFCYEMGGMGYLLPWDSMICRSRKMAVVVLPISQVE